MTSRRKSRSWPPGDQLQTLAAGIRTRLAASDLGEALGGLKKLF